MCRVQRLLGCGVGFFAVMFLLTGTPAWSGEIQGIGPIPGEQSFEGTAYRSGGIGSDEREVLQTFEYQYSLKLVFSLQNGVYMAQVPVVIRDWAGKVLLQATSRGPWLYVRLPAGKYSIEAWNGEDKKTRTIRVGTSGLNTVPFSW